MNRFFSFVSNFIDGTLAKSSQVNARFSEVGAGFDQAQNEVNTALRVVDTENATDLARIPAVAARAKKLLQFDALGHPVAANALQDDFDCGLHRVFNLSFPGTNTEPVTLGYLTAYSAALAGLPPIAGMGGKFLSTDGAGVSWTSPACPVAISTEPGMVSTTDGTGAQPTWVTYQHNLLNDTNGYFATGGATWTTHANMLITADEFGFHYANNAVLVAQTFDHKSEKVTLGAGLTIVAAVDVLTTGVTAGALTALFRYLDGAGATLSEGAATAIANGQGFKRFKVAGVTPATTASVQLIVRAVGVSVSGPKGLRIRNPKVEQGAQPTPYTNDGAALATRYKSQYTWGAGIASVTSTLGDAATATAIRDFRSAAGAQAYDARIKSTGGTNGTAGKATLAVESKVMTNTGPIGYAAEFDAGNSGAAKTINLVDGSYQKLTLTANACAITLSSVNGPPAVGRYRVKLVQDATGGRTSPTYVTGAGAITPSWLGGVAPTVAAAIGAETFLDFYWDGSKLYSSWTAWS